MKQFYLPATESDLQLLAELLREARQQPFQFAYPDREERIIELEKKWIAPTRESLFPPAIAERAEEKVSEQWYLCDEDLFMRESGVLSFRKGQKYLKDGFDSSDASICLIDELGYSHWIDNDLSEGAWLKHFTLITNDLRFEIEKGIEPAEVEFNQSVNP